MSFNLIDSAKSLFTKEIVNRASVYLGESESGVAKAISAILPAVLGGLANKAADSDGAHTVNRLAQESHASGILNTLGGSAINDSGLLQKGAGLLQSLFPGKSDGINGLIANFSGIRSSSASTLMNLVTPAVLGLIGRHAHTNNLGAPGIAALLKSQKDDIEDALPAGFKLKNSVVNFDDNLRNATRTTTAHYSDQTEKKGVVLKYLWPLLLLALLGISLFYFLGKGCNSQPDALEREDQDTTEIHTGEVAVTSAGTLDTLTGDFNYNLGKLVTIDLPNAAGKLEAGEFSTEYRLYKFLSDPNTVLDTVKGNWFEFTNVRFKTGGAEITEESMTQIKNLVAISKAYPTAKFKLGGYTDNTGTAAGNVALSQKRADAVAAILKKLGAAAGSIVGAEGYGPEWPVADNATAEGRAQNRRVAINVKAK